MSRIDRNRTNEVNSNNEQPVVKAVKTDQPQPVKQNNEKTAAATKQSDTRLYGDQQRKRIEQLYGAGAAAQSVGIDTHKARSFRDANKAYQNAVNNPATKLTDATMQGLTNYRATLNRHGVNPLEARRTNLIGAVDFLKAESTRTGGLTTLDQTDLRRLAQNGDNPRVFVRMLWNGKDDVNNDGARLAYFDPSKNQGKTIAWATRVEDLAGSRLDYQEVMRRIGWTADDIATADPKNFKLAVFTDNAAVQPRTPTTDEIIATARNDKGNFSRFGKKPESFWNDVAKYDYQAKLDDAKAKGFDSTKIEEYVNKLPITEQDVFKARQQLERSMGVNPLFTGDGTTKRPDNLNGRVGVREYITNNIVDDATLRRMANNGQVALVDMQDIGSLDKYKADLAEHRVKTGNPDAMLPLPEVPVDTTNKAAALPRASQRSIVLGEAKTGSIGGGLISAAASSFEAYDKIKSGDYAGAATTVVGNTAFGATVGAGSAAAERIVGNALERGFAGRISERGANLLVNSNTISRLGGSTAQNFLGQSVSSGALRQVVGRVAGSSIIGGVVNGGFAVHDQWQNLNNPALRSQAVGTIVGEVGVGIGAGLTGAAAGAVIGSVVPIAGTAVGAVVGFAVGVGVGMATDYGMRYFGADKAIARNVTALIDNAPKVAAQVQQFGADAARSVQTAVTQRIDQARAVVNRASEAGRAVQTFVNQRVAGAGRRLSQAAETATKFVAQTGRRVGQEVRNQVRSHVNHVINNARAVTARVSNAARTAQTFVNNNVARARATVSRATTAVSNYVAQTRQNVTSAVRSTVNSAVSTARNTVNNAVSTARATVGNAVNNIAGSAVGSLRSVFGW